MASLILSALYSMRLFSKTGVLTGTGRRCFAMRKGKRAALRLLKKQQKKEKANNEEAPTKWVAPNLRVAREIVSIRKRVREEGLKPLPAVDDIWNVNDHMQKVFSLAEAISMHRETHHPQMLNQPDALVHATVELDTRLSKKNRYLEDFQETLRYPNLFLTASTKPRIVLALCKSQEGQEEAMKAGAELVGGMDLIRCLQKGEIKTDAFHHVVAHPDILQDLTTIRGLLGKRFPNPNKGNLGMSMATMVDRFLKGMEYISKKDTLELDFGWVDVAFGSLDMPNVHLEENLSFLLRAVDAHKPPTTNHNFMTRVVVWSPPSKEHFVIPFWDHLDGYEDPRLKSVRADQEELSDDEATA